MHYYKRNLGDYYKKAGRLTMLQHGAYTLLTDACYDRERFPTEEEAIEWLWASTTDEEEAVKFVISKFFSLEDGVYVQKRIQDELDKYHENAATNKRIAIEREAKRKGNSTKRVPIVNEPSPNQEPRTNKPLTKNQEPINKDLSSSNDESKKIANCPHDSIAALYMEILPELARVAKLTDKRKRMLGATWRSDKKCQNLEFWGGYFQAIRKSNFLMGRTGEWSADFDFVINQNKMIKIIEGAYE